MACPIAPVLVAGALAGGGHTLYVQDRKYRGAAWLATLALLGGWAMYAVMFRQAPLRVVLETLSVVALVAGGVRVAWLMRARQVRSPLWEALRRSAGPLWSVFGDRSVLAAKLWLLAMLTTQWRGKARFDAWEYAVISAALVLLVALRIVRMARSRRRARVPFAALESFAECPAASACPLGFGRAAGADAARGDVA